MALTPTDPTKAQLWINGTAPNQTIDFYIPRGAKGDPGGITLGTELGTTDLNDIRTHGIYRLTAGSNATALRNYPHLGNGGVLIVTGLDATGYLIQEWYPITGNSARVSYRREFITPNWQSWRSLVTQRVDQTAGRAIYTFDEVNNREQLIYGDTGTRDVAALAGLVNSPWTVGSLTIRRVGQMVMYSAYNIQQNGASNMVLFNSLPTGFRPSDYIRFVARQHNANPAFYALEAGNGNGAVQAYQSGITGAHFTISWMTLDSWPTTLPGTAIGAIPNN